MHPYSIDIDKPISTIVPQPSCCLFFKRRLLPPSSLLLVTVVQRKLVWLQAQKNHAAEDSGGVESPLPLSHSATMSTVQAALPHSGQITDGSGESATSQHNGNTMVPLLLLSHEMS